MARQVEEGGWPLGLQPLNLRAVSFSTLFSGSPSSCSYSSSDLDTESTGSFFHDRSITLGNLMGVSSILELSRRSLRRDKMLSETLSLETKTKSNHKSKPWCFGFCLCQRDNADVIDVSTNNIVPLGHFLEVERRAAQDHRRGQQSPLIYGADELTLAQPFRDSSNSLFVDGRIMPPTRSSPWSGLDANERRKSRGFMTPCF
ncbi:hypothetical protein L1987_22300 [Smallanthus sonchifolius]|uniref:Uncharacterized protein n=1 Tax=Smallanthus sonchifolius TaxID=185202 RepID=A0ACB9IFZ1_9ASTR|nr:hypothetical protein L1987_22300 [Smallanthus sonchifolius]